MQAHVEPGVCLSPTHRVSAVSREGRVARQGVRILGQGSEQLPTGLHTARSVSQLRGEGGSEGVGG